MNLTFKKVALHHFMSFGDVEVDLRDRGFCLVVGRNGDARDAAKSNGSGKSTLFNAISYALTGATLQGLRSNLANMAFGDGCWVRLEFDADGHEYEITRSKDDPKLGTGLRIKADGVDKSGKGLRESQAALERLLPDLTPELLGSVVMLGQGMPMRLTADTPSGRKETLEHLSRSDFMIQDLKDRIARRASSLEEGKRKADDALIAAKAKGSMAEASLAKAEAALASAEATATAAADIAALENKAAKASAAKAAAESESSSASEAKERAMEALSSAKEAKGKALESLRVQHAEQRASYSAEEATLSSAVAALSSEISRLEAIKDVCPTCGQRIPGVVRPDTSRQRSERATKEGSLKALRDRMGEDEEAYREAVSGAEAKYGSAVDAASEGLASASDRAAKASEALAKASKEASEAATALESAKALRDSLGERVAEAKRKVDECKAEAESYATQAEGLEKESAAFGSRLDVISKLATMAKRDFRGILLEGVIQYIGAKAKEFSSGIFGTDGVSFGLDGNDISISYDGKDYENLSGGERQRVDLIVQFALRDMMCHYLGFSANMLVLDEISDALDAVSCQKVMGFISSSLSEVESVFVVSHHADELDIPVDGEIAVVKDGKGVSSIEQ